MGPNNSQTVKKKKQTQYCHDRGEIRKTEWCQMGNGLLLVLLTGSSSLFSEEEPPSILKRKFTS